MLNEKNNTQVYIHKTENDNINIDKYLRNLYNRVTKVWKNAKSI